MKAKMMFVCNYEEMEQLEKLDVDTVGKEKWGTTDFWFKIKEVSSVCLTDDGEINIFIDGIKTTLKYNQELFDKLTKELE